MKAPTVPAAISGSDAKTQLQLALNHIAEIYTIIGDLPYNVARDDQRWKPLVRMFDRGEQTLEELATDPIPF